MKKNSTTKKVLTPMIKVNKDDCKFGTGGGTCHC
jgi:hypothetical protein